MEVEALDLPDYSALTIEDDRSLHGMLRRPANGAPEGHAPYASTSSGLMVGASSMRDVSASSPPTPSDMGGPSPSLGSDTPLLGSSTPRANPLTDLIATEKLYVDDLASIIKRVAAAWSRTNFPPAHLDTMFRAIEAVYRINKVLLGRLIDIGPSPSSPKLLGDLLMRWIDELEAAYKRYSNALVCAFDDDSTVQCNPKLASNLASLPPIGTSKPGARSTSLVTLDTLFILPYYRLRYYKKLYAKLLRSTQAGRSDHRLLSGANEKLDTLIAMCDESLTQRSARQAEVEHTMARPSRPITPSTRTDVLPMSATTTTVTPAPADNAPHVPLEVLPTVSHRSMVPEQADPTAPNTHPSSLLASSSSTSLASAHSIDIEDLNKRLDTARTLDIFTMKPKRCRLQIQSPDLKYSRYVRRSGDVHMSFQPSSDSARREVTVRRAHLILLTDLFLVAEVISPTERSEAVSGADFWLLFPPLAGKHLRAERTSDDLAFDLVVMNRERLRMRCDSPEAVAGWVEAIADCAAFSPVAVQIQAEAPSSLNLAANPATSELPMTPRVPSSSAEVSGFAPAPDKVLPPRAFSTFSGSVTSNPSTGDPDMMPPPLRLRGLNGIATRAERRSSLGPASFPVDHHMSHTVTLSVPLGPPPGAMGGYRGPSPTSLNSFPLDGSGALSSPVLRDNRMRAQSSISRRTDPGYANPSLEAPSSSSSLMQRSRSADALRGSSESRSLPQTHYRAPSSIPPTGLPLGNDTADAEDEVSNDETDNDFLDGSDMRRSNGPIKSQIAAQMRCKVFLQHSRTQWKAMGTAKLRLYMQSPTNVKQLVVEQGDGGKAKPIISTIVLTDGVERVGKTGIAIELSDQGSHTGIIYMIQLKTEQSATGLFQQLLLGSGRIP